MAETIQVPADAVLNLLLAATDKSDRQLCRDIGRHETYLSTYRREQRTPGLSVLCEIANACGFDVYLVRGDEQIIVTPSEESA